MKTTKIEKRGVGLPAYVLEYLKLQEFEESWGTYHNTHILGSQESYVELRMQRERFKQAIEAEIARIQAALQPDVGLEEIKKAAAAFEKLLDSPVGLKMNKPKGKGKGRA